MERDRFESLSAFSATLHGHKYVFPVAVWLLENDEKGAVAQPEIRTGLVHAESNRIFEALERLDGIGAVIELPKAAGRRFFERSPSAYWDFVKAEAAVVDARSKT